MKKLLFICNVDWFFVSHRLPIAIEAVQNNYEVHVACKFTKHMHELSSHGFITHKINVKRGKLSPFLDLILILNILKIILFIKPNIVHLITIKPIIYGGFITIFFKKIFSVYSFSGLGHVFVNKKISSRMRLFFIKMIYKVSLSKKNKHLIFQNNSDKDQIKKIKNFNNSNYTIIKGSGINLKKFKFKKIPPTPLIFLMASRFIKEKGIWEYVKASSIVKKKYKNVIFKLVGNIDPENPSSLQIKDLQIIKNISSVELCSFTTDIRKIIKNSHIVVLPSYYGEGVPKILIEACALGRPIISTNIPGCKETVENGKNGILVNPKNVNLLAEAMEKLILNKHKLHEMGMYSRKIAISKFNIDLVIKLHLEIYEKSY